MTRRVTAALVILAALSASSGQRARADEHPRRLTSGAQCRTPGGAALDLAPGTLVVPAPAWAALDAEMRRLQEAETRAKAENESLRRSLREKYSGAAWWLGGAFLVGLAAGAGLELYRESR